MISSETFLAALRGTRVQFVAGVPDSLLKDVCGYLDAHLPSTRHVIAANEGSAVGMAIGYYLATGRPGLVYMQNSGLGNAVNPLASLADRGVYGIPMLLMIGWRGEVGPDGRQTADEPQHMRQGRITAEQLRLLDIPSHIVDRESDINTVVERAVALSLERGCPVALLVRKGAFAPWKRQDKAVEHEGYMSREEAIEAVVKDLPADVPIVATTGKASRELFELRRSADVGECRDFLTVGGMGHASSIAGGLALAHSDRRVVCLDGDGSVLMHLGALAVNAQRNNLVHVVLNNGAHDSVGGQPTRAASISLASVASACGYSMVASVEEAAAVRDSIEKMLQHDGSTFLEIRCSTGSRPDLGRPDRSPAEAGVEFMTFLGVEARRTC